VSSLVRWNRLINDIAEGESEPLIIVETAERDSQASPKSLGEKLGRGWM
jgi:hypothetical protein